jgi:hypothetical protein
MDKRFFSTNNYELITNIVNITLKKKYNIDNNSSFKNEIINSMKDVFSKVNPQPPNGITPEKYLDMMNIKCISMIVPNIAEILHTQSSSNNNFDQSFQTSSPSPQTLDDYHPQYDPKALPLPENSYDSNRNTVKKEFEVLQNNRQEEIKIQEEVLKKPHPQPILVNDIAPSIEDTNKEFNRRLQERNMNFNNLIQNNNQVQPVQSQMHQTLNRAVQEQFHERYQESVRYNENVEQLFPKSTDLTSIDENIILPNYQISDSINTQSPVKHSPVKHSPVKHSPVKHSPVKQSPVKHSPIKQIVEKQSINKNVQPIITKIVDNTIEEVKPQYIQKTHYFTIDSRDRDTELYPDPTHFQVNFSTIANKIEIKKINVKTNMNDIIYVIKENLSDTKKGASILKKYENILHIQNTQTIVPKIDIPYLLLNIKELEQYSPYSSTNSVNSTAFAKLVNTINTNSYMIMTTSDKNEYYQYSHEEFGKLDKMTLTLCTSNGEQLFLGADKVFVNKFEKDTLKNSVKIYINNTNDLSNGDTLYFYSNKPSQPTYIIFQDMDNILTYNKYNLIVNEENDKTINISINIIIDNSTEPIDFGKFLKKGDYLALLIDNSDKFYKILQIDGTNITIQKNILTNLNKINISKVGYAKNNGNMQSIHKGDLLYSGGVKVNAVDKSFIEIDIQCENISDDLMNSGNQVHFIKQKRQISYTFNITTLEKV